MNDTERIDTALRLPEASMLGPQYSGKGKQHLCIVTAVNGNPRARTVHASVHQALRDLGVDSPRNGVGEWPESWLIDKRKALKMGESTTFETPDGTIIEMKLVFSTRDSRELLKPLMARAKK